LAFQQWKNFENPLRIDKVIAMSSVCSFFGPPCSHYRGCLFELILLIIKDSYMDDNIINNRVWQYRTAKKKLARFLFDFRVVNATDDDCDQQIPSVALRLQQLTPAARRR